MKKEDIALILMLGFLLGMFSTMSVIGNSERQDTKTDLVYTCYEKDNMIIMEVSNYTRGENGNKRQTERESSIKD